MPAYRAISCADFEFPGCCLWSPPSGSSGLEMYVYTQVEGTSEMATERQNGIRNGMKKLKRRIEGEKLINPPRTSEQRVYAEGWGFREMPTGEWMRLGPSRNPPLKIIKEYGLGRLCRACHAPFRSKKARGRYCQSCRSIMEDHLQKWTLTITAANNAPEETKRAVLEELEQFLQCSYPIKGGTKCGWMGNGIWDLTGGRWVLLHLPQWIESMHCHHMRHVFWNRFCYSPRFFPQNIPDQEKEESYREVYDPKYREEWELPPDEFFVEIQYPQKLGISAHENRSEVKNRQEDENPEK